MKWYPILFNGDMVRAILDGTKTQTRRPIKREAKPAPGMVWDYCLCREIDPSDTPCMVCEARFGDCPYGRPGDRLWVRESVIIAPKNWNDGSDSTHIDNDGDPRIVQYLATEPNREGANQYHLRATPSIHMPRWASRISLLVTGVRAERVQDITNDDALREGIHPLACDADESPRELYRELWNHTYGAGAWDRNDGVWVTDFQRVER